VSSVHFSFAPVQICLNGTSPDELVEQHEKLLGALRGAQEALTAAAPNGRDWQLKPAESFAHAQREHAKRADVLRLLVLAVERELEAILDQAPACPGCGRRGTPASRSSNLCGRCLLGRKP